jgi:hypothetical protein
MKKGSLVYYWDHLPKGSPRIGLIIKVIKYSEKYTHFRILTQEGKVVNKFHVYLQVIP